MWWYTERKDLMFQIVILEILIEMALVTIQNEQPVATNLTVTALPVPWLAGQRTDAGRPGPGLGIPASLVFRPEIPRAPLR